MWAEVEKLSEQTKRLFVLGAVLLAYSPLLDNFFWSDDWYILALSQINSLGEFIRFFSFVPSEHVTPVYRPLSTEVFFFVMRSLFGLQPIAFHLVGFVVWAVGAWLVYQLIRALRVMESSGGSMLAWILFVTSASHFTRLTYISAFQEILMFACVIGAVLVMQRSEQWYGLIGGLVLFTAALMSKESAVVLPGLIVLTQWHADEYRVRIRNYIRYIPFVLMLCAYLILRFGVRGAGGAGEAYEWDFSFFRAIHTGTWYGLWSVGMPEFILDYVGSGGTLLPRYWTDFGMQGVMLFGAWLALMAVGISALVFWIVDRHRSIHGVVIGSAWYVIGILPILFLPTHKFALGQSVALIGICIAIATIASSIPKALRYVSMVMWIVFQFISIHMYYDHHVSIQRSTISQNVYMYMMDMHQTPPQLIYFTNDRIEAPAEWGVSKQIDQAVGQHFFTVLYGKDQPIVLYEDYGKRPSEDSGAVLIGSSQFFP